MSLAITPPTSSYTDSPLPNELADQVFSLLERSQFPLVSQLSKAYYEEYYPTLYQNIFISIYGGPPIHPASFVAEEDEELPNVRPALGMDGAIYLALRHLPLLTTPLLPQPLEDRFTFVTRLCMTTHTDDPTSCLGYGPIIMPNLETLQFIPHPNTDLPEILDVCGHSRMRCDWRFLLEDPTTHPTCTLLSALRPRQLILGGPLTTLTGDGAGLWREYGDFPPKWLKDIVVFVGQNILVPGRSFLSHLPPTFECLTLVFEPLEGETEWKWADFHGQAESHHAPYTPGGQIGHLHYKLAEIFRGMARYIVIVGLGGVEPATIGNTDEEEMEDFMRKKVYAACMSGGGLTSEEAEQKTERIEFLPRIMWEDRQADRLHGGFAQVD